MTMTAGVESDVVSSRQLEWLFRQVFFAEYHTLLIGGADEPVYVPGGDHQPHRLCYREDYFASALHEVSHWCIAGPERRLQPDFGYWYNPDGRTAGQQRAFEQVEVKPQALEWIFTTACGLPFTVSADNLSSDDCGAQGPSREFLAAVERQTLDYCSTGLPERARIFVVALGNFYRTAGFLDPKKYRGGLALE
jgi:elongation factor P hydroxylase